MKHVKMFENFIVLEQVETITLKQVEDYLLTKKDFSKYKRREGKYPHGDYFNYFFQDNDSNEFNYDIVKMHNGNILLNFQEKIIKLGMSLADPTKNFQNTSAHKFTTKKYKLNRDFSTMQFITKAIDKFFTDKNIK